MRRTTTWRGSGDRSRAGGGAMLVVSFRTVTRDRQQRFAHPFRPAVTRSGSMCAEQLADLKAAQNGVITWAQYHQKWGLAL